MRSVHRAVYREHTKFKLLWDTFLTFNIPLIVLFLFGKKGEVCEVHLGAFSNHNLKRYQRQQCSLAVNMLPSLQCVCMLCVSRKRLCLVQNVSLFNVQLSGH